MHRPAVHILALALTLCCLLSCGGGKARIIPRGKLARIYEELYLADRWSDSKQEYRLATDTTAFYETILESYGYTSADYRATVEHYLEDPERFSRILKKTSARLSAKSKELNKSADRIQQILEMLERAKDLAPTYRSLTDAPLDSVLKLVYADTSAFRMEGRVGEEAAAKEPADTLTSAEDAPALQLDAPAPSVDRLIRADDDISPARPAPLGGAADSRTVTQIER